MVSFSGRDLLPSSYCLVSVSSQGDRGQGALWNLFNKALIPFKRVLIHKYLLKVQFTNTIALDIRSSTSILGGHKYSDHKSYILVPLLYLPIDLYNIKIHGSTQHLHFPPHIITSIHFLMLFFPVCNVSNKNFNILRFWPRWRYR